MNKKVWWIIILGHVLLPYPAAAHVLETDYSIGAVLHVSPDDDPIAGEPSNFFFEFKDKEKKFTPFNCDCVVAIRRSGQAIHSQPLFQNNAAPSLTNVSFSFTFPDPGIYQIQVTGQPREPNTFPPFTLTYDIRVAPAPIAGASPHTFHLVGAGILTVVVASLIIRERLQLRQK